MTDVIYYNQTLETADRETLRQHQWERLGVLMRQIWPTNQFYRRKYLAAGVKDPAEIRTWEDFYRLPFTKKHELVVDQASYPPYGTNVTFPLDQYARLHQTSGTTGRPLRWLDTEDSWTKWWGDLWCYVYQGAGVTAADRIFFAFSFGPFVGFWSAHEGARKLGALVITAGGLDTESRMAAIARTRPTVLLCTPSYALHLAEVADEKGFDMRGAGIRKVILAGEPGANIPATRERIQSAYGAQVFDHTGMTEVGAHGFSCIREQGTHLTEAEFVFEVINPETGEHVAPVDGIYEGELVVTNLGRGCMPLIRYRTHDLVRLTQDRCSCGRIFSRMLGGIIGRADDMIVVRGINLFPSAFESIVRGYPEIAEFLIEVYKIKGMDEVRLKVEPLPQVTDTKSLLARLAEELRARLGLRIDVQGVEPGALPRYQMKAKRLVRLPD